MVILHFRFVIGICTLCNDYVFNTMFSHENFIGCSIYCKSPSSCQQFNSIPTVLSYFSTIIAAVQPSTTSDTLDLQIWNLLEFRDIILLILLLCLTAYSLYYWINTPKCILSLEIGNTKCSACCSWFALLHSPLHYDFTVSAPVQSLSVQGTIFPHLHIDWPQISVTHMITDIAVILPK